MKALVILVCLALAAPVALADQSHANVRVEVLAQTSNSWNGSALPSYPEGTPELRILRITIPAGVTLPMHKHPVINAGIMLEGNLTVISEAGDTMQLSAGDSIVELVDQWHYGRNDGESDAVVVVFYAGVAGQPISQAR